MNIYKLSLVVLTGLILAAVCCNKNDVNEVYVTAERGLSLRQEPTRNSKIITLIPLQAKVIIMNENGPREKIDNIDGRWVRVKYNESYGWVFDGYLNKYASDIQIKKKVKIGEGKAIYTSTESGGIAFYLDKTVEIGFNTCEEQYELKGMYEIDNQYLTIKISESPESIKYGIPGGTAIKFQIISDDQIRVVEDVSVDIPGLRFKRGFCGPKKNDVYTILEH